MGTASGGFNVVYDTGSDWLVIETSTCSNCVGFLYVTSSSTAYSAVPNSTGERLYGSASLTGFEAIDKVCLTNTDDYCVNPF